MIPIVFYSLNAPILPTFIICLIKLKILMVEIILMLSINLSRGPKMHSVCNQSFLVFIPMSFQNTSPTVPIFRTTILHLLIVNVSIIHFLISHSSLIFQILAI